MEKSVLIYQKPLSLPPVMITSRKSFTKSELLKLQQLSITVHRGVMFVVRSFLHFANWATSFRSFLLCTLISMNAQKRRNTFATRPRFISTEMAKGSMRCLVLEKNDYMIAFGCTLEIYTEFAFLPFSVVTIALLLVLFLHL